MGNGDCFWLRFQAEHDLVQAHKNVDTRKIRPAPREPKVA
jgi:plasmid maintenance system antidote protein VapI